MSEVNFNNKPAILWEEHWLEQWNFIEECDKKVLAVLYWDRLTDEQKAEFSDAEYMEVIRLKQKQKQEMMQNPVAMRQHFLNAAAPLLDQMVNAATGKGKVSSQNDYAIAEVWGVLKNIMENANDPAPLLNLKGKAIEDQIDEILTKVSNGEIDFTQAKEYMSLVSAGFELQKLPELMAKLELLEAS